MQPPPADRIRDHFLGWQCRIRQIAMRQEGGRPSPGMRPRRAHHSGPRAVAGADGADRADRAGGDHRLLPLPGAEDARSRARSTSAASPSCRPTISSSRELFSDRLTAVLPEASPLAADADRGGDVPAGVRPVPPVLPPTLRGLSRCRRATRRARRRFGTTGCSIRPCRTRCRCWRFAPIGRWRRQGRGRDTCGPRPNHPLAEPNAVPSR